MADRYKCFAELTANERLGIDYRICVEDRGAQLVVFAPHGGWIEPNTSEIAEAVAGLDFSFYAFEGLENRPHTDLHITSHRFCTVSSRLFPVLPASQACDCVRCRTGSAAWNGAFILRTADYAHYLATVRPMQLRDKITSLGVDQRWPAMNFGESKGRGFDHVVILPTEPMRLWLSDHAANLKPQSRAKFYVALTRGRHSVAIAMDWGTSPLPTGFSLYERAS